MIWKKLFLKQNVFIFLKILIAYCAKHSSLLQNFREDYCRFEFSLLENLEQIGSLSECQLACQYITNCSYFVYDKPTKICRLNTLKSNRPICDIIHGTPEPDFNTCVNDGHLIWASSENNFQAGQPSSNPDISGIYDLKFFRRAKS